MCRNFGYYIHLYTYSGRDGGERERLEEGERDRERERER